MQELSKKQFRVRELTKMIAYKSDPRSWRIMWAENPAYQHWYPSILRSSITFVRPGGHGSSTSFGTLADVRYSRYCREYWSRRSSTRHTTRAPATSI